MTVATRVRVRSGQHQANAGPGRATRKWKNGYALTTPHSTRSQFRSGPDPMAGATAACARASGACVHPRPQLYVSPYSPVEIRFTVESSHSYVPHKPRSPSFWSVCRTTRKPLESCARSFLARRSRKD